MNIARFNELVTINLRLCFIEILSNRTRSVITTFGIFLGIATLLANMAFLRALDDNVKESLLKIGGLNIITLSVVDPETKEDKLLFQHSNGLRMSDAVVLKKDVPGIQQILRYNEIGWRRIRGGGNRTHARLKAIGPHHLRIYNYTVGIGQPFSEYHFQRKVPVCLIGEQRARRLFEEPENALDRIVVVDHRSYRVIGIITTEKEWDQRSREVLIPYSVYESRIAGKNGRVAEIALMVEDISQMERIKQLLTARLISLHRGVEDFEIDTNVEKINEMKKTGMSLKILMFGIAFISLAVGGVSIMNIMFATIGDRIREIGIRKALGARKSDVFIQFLIEAVFLCCLGGIPGMLLGAAITLLPENFFPFQPNLKLFDYSLGIVFILISGIFSGLFPALRAAKMNPVEALRY
jgi:ABC-type antimicrobial peptide transport system permease subunit